MKTKIKILTRAGISLMLLFSLMLFSFSIQQPKPWVAPESAKKLVNPVAVNDAGIAAGKAIYIASCNSCHGVKGKGNGPKAASLDVLAGDFTTDKFQSQTDGEIYWKITEGRNPMPSFKTKLTDEKRWQVFIYVRELGKEAKKK